LNGATIFGHLAKWLNAPKIEAFTMNLCMNSSGKGNGKRGTGNGEWEIGANYEVYHTCTHMYYTYVALAELSL